MKTRFKIILLVIVAIISVGGFFALKNGWNKDTVLNDIKSVFISGDKSKNLVSRTEESQTSLSDLQSGKKQTYTHQRLGFSFEFPEGFKVGEFGEGIEGEEQILVQKNNVGFQLKITPFEEDIILTEQRIKEDIPDIVIKEPLQIKVGEAIALAFLSESESLGQTREVWWVYKGNLYQITTYTEFDETMVAILETWKF